MTSVKPEEQFYDKLHQKELEALWLVIQRLVPKECHTDAVPFVWKWADVYPLALEGGDVWPLERGGERRVLILSNPGLGERYAATNTIYGGIQIVMPGEIAPCHRHWASAVRFVVKGNGIGYTGVEGEKLAMEDYDLVLTPSLDWHDHRNDGDSPILWLDVLDVPLLNLLQLSKFESYEEDLQHPIDKPDDYSDRVYGDKVTRPVKRPASYKRRRPYTYKWRDIRPVLMAATEWNPFDGVAIEYINPVVDGPTLPTFTCWAQRLKPDEHTRAHRHTSSALYHVIEGYGYSVVEGKRLDWQKGDTFAVPHWMWHEHLNLSEKEHAILFSANDGPVMESLGLHFEEEYVENDGHQCPKR